jgi:hypothetical protein
VTDFDHADLIAKLRRCTALPDWADVPFSQDEICELLLIAENVAHLRVAQEVGARVVQTLRAKVRELRDAQQWVVARDGGRWCERCEQEVARGQAYDNLPGTGGHVQHIHCPDQPRAIACTDTWMRHHAAGTRLDCATCAEGRTP